MEIVSIEQCLKQLNNAVKTQIINKQDEILGVSVLKCLHERFRDKEFRKKLLSKLSSKERKYLLNCIQEYSPYLNEAKKDEEVATIERKLTLLFLRQKGLLYKLDERKHLQANVVPVEIIESYFELTFNKGKLETALDSPLVTRKYLYFLIELLMFLKERTGKKRECLKLLKERISNSLDWSMLIRFIEDLGLVEKQNNQLVVKNKQCDVFFQQSNEEIKQSLARFCVNDFIKDDFSRLFLIWVIFHASDEGVELKEIVQYLKKHNQEVEKNLDGAIEQLKLLEIVTITDKGRIFCPIEQIEGDNQQQGMEVAIGQFLVPVYISNHALWKFRCWGRFQEWEVMVHVVFSNLSFRQALLEGQELRDLLQPLALFLPETVIKGWQQSFLQWQKEEQPIVKKQNITLYSVTEPIYVNYVEEHWHNWCQKADNGIIIEKEFELLFEELLEKLTLRVIEGKIEEVVPKEGFSLSVINEFPEVSSVIPEVTKLPKQWFILTSFDEKTIHRMAKQAIVLQLCLQIENDHKEIIKLSPIKLAINNGCYEIGCKNTKNISFKQIKKIALVHPLYKDVGFREESF